MLPDGLPLVRNIKHEIIIDRDSKIRSGPISPIVRGTYGNKGVLRGPAENECNSPKKMSVWCPFLFCQVTRGTYQDSSGLSRLEPNNEKE